MALSSKEKIRFLGMVNLFESLSGMEIGMIAEVAEEKNYAKGDLIVKEGDNGDSLFVVVSGRIKITKGEDLENLVALLGEGKTVGELSLFDAQPRSANITAVDEVCMLSLSRPEFVKLIRRNPDISLSMLSIMAERVRKATNAYTMLK